jgi:hypothetical protein
MKMLHVLLLCAAIVISGAACVGKSQDTREYLEFSSGGAFHPSGHGQWSVRLCRDGTLSVRHTVKDKVVLDSIFTLTHAEVGRFFGLFCRINVKGMGSSRRQGLPDEVAYIFVLKDGSGIFKKSVWIGDARDNAAIMELVSYTETLIEKYTGERPVLR